MIALYTRIKRYFILKKRLKEARKKDPYIYPLY